MKKRLDWFWENVCCGIRGKILISISCVIVFTISFLIFVITSNYSGKLEKDNIQISNSSINDLISSINEYFDEVVSITNQAEFNDELQGYIQGRNRIKNFGSDGPNLIKIMMIGEEIFGNSFDARTNITMITVFDRNGILLYKSPYSLKSPMSNFKSQIWYKKAVKAEGDPVFSGVFNHADITGDNEPVFSVSRELQASNSDSYGVILIDANLNTIKNICDSLRLQKEGQIFIFDKAGSVIYTPGTALSKKIIGDGSATKKTLAQTFSKSPAGDFTLSADKSAYQVVFNHIGFSGWTICTITPYNTLMADIRSLTALIISIGVLCLVMMIAVIYLLMSRIIQPLFKLKACMDVSDRGNFDSKAEVTSKDEIGILAASYNRMLDRINNLMAEILSEQKRLRISELKALQSQINPHFLYNTLDIIVWMAEKKSDMIVPTTEALARFFRISLSRGDDLITVEDELEHVRSYLLIQRVRFANKFSFTISASEKTKKYKVPKIILQPVVENAIYHGINIKPSTGEIKIEAVDAFEKLIFVVSDDGAGMDEEKCRTILDPSYKHGNSEGSGVGLRNVNERIKLNFGPEYGVKIESAPGAGTKVFLTLPVVTE